MPYCTTPGSDIHRTYTENCARWCCEPWQPPLHFLVLVSTYFLPIPTSNFKLSQPTAFVIHIFLSVQFTRVYLPRYTQNLSIILSSFCYPFHIEFLTFFTLSAYKITYEFLIPINLYILVLNITYIFIIISLIFNNLNEK